jgi:hypothetical protein
MATATQAPAVAGTRTYDCPTCGCTLQVFGRERHRIYFEMAEHLDDPVMDRACPECDDSLPGKTGASAS